MRDFNSALGLQPGAEPCSVELETAPEHQAAPGMIHFAVLATLAEVAAARAVGGHVIPTSLHLNLLRRAAPGRLTGRGRLLRRGRRLWPKARCRRMTGWWRRLR